MTMTAKRLPLDDQSFAEMIDQNFVYADKTRYIHEMLTGGKQYFLSRPRRFGKTLLLDTIEELFSGDRSRFRGLWIDGPESGYDYPRHPVLSLSLSIGAESPEILKENLFTDLKEIADKAGLGLRGASPDAWFGNLIQDLGEKTDSRVVVLIDEYDAAVAGNVDNPKVAEANAKVLHYFLATLKHTPVSERVRLTLITGLSRYALTITDTGPNHLNDITFDPDFAGVCGITEGEFGPLFEDRLPGALADLKKAGKIGKSASPADLRAEILRWYGGYDWGGKTRVLNPWSTLRFFQSNDFSGHWTRTGLPANLAAMIRDDPRPFAKSRVASAEFEKMDLNGLSAVPCLLQGGYLTLDRFEGVPRVNPLTGKTEIEDAYLLRFPNFEIADSYDRDCFKALFGETAANGLENNKKKLEAAFPARDAKTVGDVLRGHLAKLTRRQRPKDESAFHGHVQLILSAMGFKVRSGPAGAVGRRDLTVELPGRVHLIIGLKHCPKEDRLKPRKRNLALAAVVLTTIPPDVVHERMAPLAEKAIGSKKFKAILDDRSARGESRQETDRLLWRAALDKLSETKLNAALAEAAVKGLLSREQIKAALRRAGANESDLTDEAIGEMALGGKALDEESLIEYKLSRAADRALRDIIERDHHDLTGDDAAAETIGLGLAIHGPGNRLKADFGPEGSFDPAPPIIDEEAS